jgi:hypothetical protein
VPGSCAARRPPGAWDLCAVELSAWWRRALPAHGFWPGTPGYWGTPGTEAWAGPGAAGLAPGACPRAAGPQCAAPGRWLPASPGPGSWVRAGQLGAASALARPCAGPEVGCARPCSRHPHAGPPGRDIAPLRRCNRASAGLGCRADTTVGPGVGAFKFSRLGRLRRRPKNLQHASNVSSLTHDEYNGGFARRAVRANDLWKIFE